jgi:DNA polymerase II small subunit
MNEGGGNGSSSMQIIRYVIDHGYQVSPSASALISKYVEELGIQKLQSLIFNIMEDKARRENDASSATETKTLTAQDFKDFRPDDFAGSTEPVASDVTGTTTEDLGEEFEVVTTPTASAQLGPEGYSQLFQSRYQKLARILKDRSEARGMERISKVDLNKGKWTLCGLVFSKRSLNSGGVELTLDDQTGKATVYVVNEDLIKSANDVCLDQCVVIESDAKEGRLIARKIIQPDLPNRMATTSKKTAYVVLLSDLHIGSKKFLDGAFNRFLQWINSGKQSEDEILRHLKYVVVAGDIVDGVGVFPNQEFELVETSIIKQYEMVAKMLQLIPKHLHVTVIPGNHDSTRQALPQPIIPKKYAPMLYDFQNLEMLEDPSIVKLNGVSILIFHGRSLDDILATTPGLSYEKPQEAMRVLLRARHLAPMFGGRTPIAPEVEDRLVIDQVPDIFHAGHVHTVGVDRYRGTLIVNSGTWQGQTSYQANLGIMPRPGLVPIVNLATLDVELREFLTSSPNSFNQVNA